MAEIRIDSEDHLFETILESDTYKEFREKPLRDKIHRESQAWQLIAANRGKYSKDLLNRVFDIVDYYEPNKRWFGQLLATPNRNWIFESAIDHINRWFDELLFSENELGRKLDTCLKDLKIKGASKGLATLLLYLSDPHSYNIWVNKTQEGLLVLGRIQELTGTDWGGNYILFNQAATKFRDQFGFKPQEIDWILWFVASYVESSHEYFTIDEDVLITKGLPVSVDDEPDLDDVVGEPMELQVMRWSPTNEMGVVALFIEFRKELGFPIIEIIRTRFPDAAVFEKTSKGYIRRYIEFEFKSSGFKTHLKSKRKCHYVVCWEHNWKDCPVPVIELKQEIPDILKKTSNIC